LQPSWSNSNRTQLRAVLLGMANDKPTVLKEADRLRPTISQHWDIVFEDLYGKEDLADVEADVAVVMGGDGSMLRAAKQMGHRQWPVVGVNLGRLGFLADLAPDEIGQVLAGITAGNCELVEHLMLECSVETADKTRAATLGLNEAAIMGGPRHRLLDIDLYVDSELATTYSCDGLIVSTPVGSTGHSLSAGGPILRSDLQAFVVSPISPHTLTVRPLVDAADRVYHMVVRDPGEHTELLVDGQALCRLSPGDRVCVERSDAVFRTVQVGGHTYYKMLRDKLDWGGRIRSKREP